MNSCAEAHVADHFALNVVFVGTVPPARVAICSAQEEKNLPPFIELNSAEFRDASGGAEEGLNRRLKAYRFLECRFGEPAGIGSQFPI